MCLANLRLLLVWFMALNCSAQTSLWTNRFTGNGGFNDQPTAIATDASGNVFVTGSASASTLAGGYEYATIKYSSDGVPLWTNRYNGAGSRADFATAIAVDAEGNVFVTGGSEDSVGWYGYVTIKYSNEGGLLWINRYSGPTNTHNQPTEIAVDGDGNVVVAGRSYGGGNAGDYVTIKYSSGGTPLWINRYNGSGNNLDLPTALAIDAAGTIFVTGYSRNTNTVGSEDYLTLAYSSDGGLLWEQRYDGTGHWEDAPAALKLDRDGNVLVTGSSSSTSGFTTADYLTIKYAPNGVPLWTNRYDGPGNSQDNAYDLAVDGSGNVFVTGGSRSGGTPNSADYLTLKYAPDGGPLWTNRFHGQAGADNAFDIAVDQGNNVMVTGSSSSINSADFVTIAYANTGGSLWTNRFNGEANGIDTPAALVIDNVGNVIVTGSTTGNGTAIDYATVKYASILPLLKNPQVNSNGFAFAVTGIPGAIFALQTSTNNSDWQTLRQISIPAGGRTNLQEAIVAGTSRRFFRVLKL